MANGKSKWCDEEAMEEAISVVLKFEQAINSRSADAVCALLTPDSIFVDSLGNQIEGIDKMRSAWEGYFVPDYAISHSVFLQTVKS
jgi:ketosteroid isomerase-like protein